MLALIFNGLSKANSVKGSPSSKITSLLITASSVTVIPVTLFFQLIIYHLQNIDFYQYNIFRSSSSILYSKNCKLFSSINLSLSINFLILNGE